MKKIRYVLAIAMVAVISAMMVSCGNENDEPEGDDLEEQLQGTWNFVQMDVSTMGQSVTLTAADLDKYAGENGISDYYDRVLDFSGSKVNGTPYYIKGNKINVPKWYGDQWGTVSFKGSTLHIVYETEEQGVDITIDISYKRSGRAFVPTFTRTDAAIILSAAKNLR